MKLSWKIIIPLVLFIMFGFALLVAHNQNSTRQITTLPEKTSAEMFEQQPSGNIDETIKAFDSYYEDTQAVLNEDVSSDIKPIESEISNAYTEEYEKTDN